nr:hypothetical protein [Deltaproteobacteria bacterium]
MRRAEQILAWSCVAAALLGGCKRWRGGGEDAGVPDAGPRGPALVQLPPTEERWQWVGTLYPGADGQTGAVLLLHQLGSNRAEWQPLIDRLQQPPAITVLSLDLRGHGDSVRGPQSDRQTWEGFGEDPARWAGLLATRWRAPGTSSTSTRARRARWWWWARASGRPRRWRALPTSRGWSGSR